MEVPMAKNTFEDMIEKERERLNGLRDDAMKRRKEIDTEIVEVDRELSAIAAYENAKAGKKKQQGTRSTGRRSELLTLLSSNPDGLSRADILDKLGLKGNKAGEQSISNALSNLKKQNKLSQKDGRYLAA